jgi:nitroreductase
LPPEAALIHFSHPTSAISNSLHFAKAEFGRTKNTLCREDGRSVSFMKKPATAGHPIHELIRERWSPRAFLDKAVEPAKLLALLEAARWAPSSYNEQPWFYLVAPKQEREEFAKMLGCLVPGNQAWAKAAAVLMISVVKKAFDRNGKPNRCAIHDVGLASENMVLEAVAQGLATHGMAGIEVEKICEVYGLPENFEPMAGWAIGYAGEPDMLEGALKEQELAPRERRDLKEFVFGGAWGKTAGVVREEGTKGT